MLKEKIVLNYSYNLILDENDLVALKSVSKEIEHIYYIHPVYAMLLAFFNGENTLEKNISFIKELFSISEKTAYNLMTPFINNPSRIIISYADCNYIFPERTLITHTGNQIREKSDISKFKRNNPFSAHKAKNLNINLHEYFKIKYVKIDDLSTSLVHAGHAQSFKDKQSICIGCFYKDTIIGHAIIIISNIFIEAYVLMSLFVLPMFRGIGIGSELLKRILMPLFKESNRNILVRLNNKHNDFDLSKKFALKNNLQSDPIGIISLVVDAYQWINKTKSFLGNKSEHYYKYKLFEELHNDEIKYIKDYSEKNLETFLQPFWKFSEEKKLLSIFIFDKEDNIEGWNIASYNPKIHELHLYCTYTMPSARKNGAGMKSWIYLSNRIDTLNLKVKNISLDVAEDNVRAYKLFKIITEGIPTEEIRYYQLQLINNK
ncbi:MAG: GNAT family N-acetyltransferase [Tannerella sp.]|jgi:GNAT superfamily N-acetyltransferase|nr:GNAT family N-acetyltransferase [Tannerella sp.]